MTMLLVLNRNRLYGLIHNSETKFFLLPDTQDITLERNSGCSAKHRTFTVTT